MIGLALTPHLARSKAWWPDGAKYAADFLSQRYMKNGVHIPQSTAFTFTRASEKLAQTTSGEWKLFPPDVPAITDLGLFVEPEETFYPVNALLEGAVPGLLGAGGVLPTNWGVLISAGLSIEVVHTGMHGDAPYIRLRIYGTTTGTDFQIALNAFTQTATMGETWTTALSLRHVAGETTGITPYARVVEEANGAFVAAGSTEIPFSSTFERRSASRTLANGTTTNVRARFRLQFDATDSETDVSIDLLAPTIINGALTGTPALTGGTNTQVRAADAITLQLPTEVDTITSAFQDGADQTIPVTQNPFVLPNALNGSQISEIIGTHS